MVKAIIFDLSGVVFSEGLDVFIRKLSQKYNSDFSDLKFEMRDGKLGTLYRINQISSCDFWGEIIKKFRIPENGEELAKMWNSSYTVCDCAVKIILDLRRKYKVYYLSDSVKERIDYLRNRYDFERWFEGGIFSHEVGFRKPNPEIYKMILRKFDLKPDEAIFIDDKEKNLHPASDLGMKTIIFENCEKLKQKLKENSVDL